MIVIPAITGDERGLAEIVIPAIDILDGKAVRRVRSGRDGATVYAGNEGAP